MKWAKAPTRYCCQANSGKRARLLFVRAVQRSCSRIAATKEEMAQKSGGKCTHPKVGVLEDGGSGVREHDLVLGRTRRRCKQCRAGERVVTCLQLMEQENNRIAEKVKCNPHHSTPLRSAAGGSKMPRLQLQMDMVCILC